MWNTVVWKGTGSGIYARFYKGFQVYKTSTRSDDEVWEGEDPRRQALGRMKKSGRRLSPKTSTRSGGEIREGTKPRRQALGLMKKSGRRRSPRTSTRSDEAILEAATERSLDIQKGSPAIQTISCVLSWNNGSFFPQNNCSFSGGIIIHSRS